MKYLQFLIVTSYQAILDVVSEISYRLNSFKISSRECPYDQMYELQESGRLTKEDSTMLLELDPRLQEEEHISQFLMMSCQKKTPTLKQVEDTLRNGILQD